MSLNLNIIQKPLDVTESHSDHTWNIKMNDWSGYTDIRLVVDIYKNPYENDLGPNNTTGTAQDSGKIARLLVPVNEYGYCIFNVETIVRNIVQPNPRNLTMFYNVLTDEAENNPYLVYPFDSNLVANSATTSQATIVNNRQGIKYGSTIDCPVDGVQLFSIWYT